MRLKPGHTVGAALSRRLPEKRMIIQSDTGARFVRLSPFAQLSAICGATTLFAWTIFASAALFTDTIDTGGVRAEAERKQALYEQRLNALSAERDRSVQQARAAQARAGAALSEMSLMQSALLASEDRRRELEGGLNSFRTALHRMTGERDEARAALQETQGLLAQAEDDGQQRQTRVSDMETVISFLSEALETAGAERDRTVSEARRAEGRVSELLYEARLTDERNDRIFEQLEEAVEVSLTPLDEMFRRVGYEPERVIESIRRGYSGQGGPLTPISFSTSNRTPDESSARANAILREMDRVNLYRIAVQKIPFHMPVSGTYRFTSGFGPRWGRMHNGSDFAAAHGSPIYATADGVVSHAGWSAGYGQMIKVRHDFGVETRYAHLSRIHVRVGQSISRGDRIGDMGNSGRSTGTHLHYEIRESGKPVNPMTYIRAARDVF